MVGENVSFPESGRTRVLTSPLRSLLFPLSRVIQRANGAAAASLYAAILWSRNRIHRHGGERVCTRWSGRANSVEISRIISFKAFNQCPSPQRYRNKIRHGVRLVDSSLIRENVCRRLFHRSNALLFSFFSPSTRIRLELNVSVVVSDSTRFRNVVKFSSIFTRG